MSGLKRAVEYALLAIVVAFAAVFGSKLGAMVVGGDPKAVETFLGGCFGAFFAFLFVRLAEFLNKLFERARANSAALVALQHFYIEASLTLSDNEGALETWRAIPGRTPPTLWMDRLSCVEIPRDLLLVLTNIDLMNDLVDMHSRLRRVNTDFEAFNRANERVADIFVKDRNFEAYQFALRAMNDHASALDVFLVEEQRHLSESLASIRVVLADRSLGEHALAALTRKRYPRDFQQRHARALRALNAEATERTANNAARIAALKRKATASTDQ